MKILFSPLFRLNQAIAKGISGIVSGGLGVVIHYFVSGWLVSWLVGIVGTGVLSFSPDLTPAQRHLLDQNEFGKVIFSPTLLPFVVAMIVLVILAFVLPILLAVNAKPIYTERREEKRRKKYSTFGTARHAKTNELLQNGLQGNGIVFGRKDGKLIEKPADVEGHVLVVGGTGTGKSRGVAIPTLLRWQGAAVVIDIKGELSKITQRSRPGRVYVFNPEQGGDSYNPLHIVKGVDDAQELARYLLPESQNSDPFWTKAAQGILAAAALEGARNGETLTSVAERLCAAPSQQLIDELVNSQDRAVRLLAAVAADAPEKTLGGIMTELRTKLITLAADENIERATGRADFTPDSLEEGATIYISVSEHMLSQFKELFALMIGQFMRHLAKRPGGAQPPILLCLDELPRLGKLSGLVDGLATLRSRNVHIMGVIQSMAQLDRIYGEDERKVIADNCRFKFVLSATDPETQKYFSDLAGQRTAMAKGVTVGAGLIPNFSSAEQGVPLVRPEDWAHLERPILFAPKVQPAQLDLAFWDLDKTLRNLVKISDAG